MFLILWCSVQGWAESDSYKSDTYKEGDPLAWACMGGKGKHDRCMGMHGEALGSEDVELAAVLIVGAEGLECFGSHTEDEVVGEDRVVVLEYGCDLTLGLAFQVKAD